MDSAPMCCTTALATKLHITCSLLRQSDCGIAVYFISCLVEDDRGHKVRAVRDVVPSVYKHSACDLATDVHRLPDRKGSEVHIGKAAEIPRLTQSGP